LFVEVLSFQFVVNRKITSFQAFREYFVAGIKSTRHCNAHMNRAIPPSMEQKMKYLSRMKIVARFQKRMQTKAEHRRAKLIEKLEEQLGMAEALLKGQRYSKTVSDGVDAPTLRHLCARMVALEPYERRRPWRRLALSG
jgi:hypothetical protein